MSAHTAAALIRRCSKCCRGEVAPHLRAVPDGSFGAVVVIDRGARHVLFCIATTVEEPRLLCLARMKKGRQLMAHVVGYRYRSAADAGILAE